MATGYWTEGKVVNGTNVGGGTFVATPTQSAANAAQPGTYSTGFSGGGNAAGTSGNTFGYSYTPSQAPSNVRSIDTVIPATDLTKLETPLPIVPKPVLDNPFADITSSNNLLGVTTATDGMSPEVGNTQFGQDMTNAADLIGKAIGQKPNAEEIYLRREREAGIQQKQQTVNTYQTQLNQIVADAQAKQLSVVGQGRGIPEAIIGGQQAQISREAAIQALPVQALLSAAQGDLTFAQNRLDKLAQLAIEDANATYEQKKDMFTFAYNYASDQQKTRLAQAEKAADRLYETQKFNIQTRTDLAKTALTQGNTDVFKTLMGLDTEDPKFSEKVSSAFSGMVTTGTDNTQNTADQLSFLRTTIKEAETLSGAAGTAGISKWIGDVLVGDTKFRRLEAKTNTLRTNVLTLMTDPNIKKFFGPQMSEADVRLMTAAGTTLNPENNSPEDMKLELKRLDNLLSRMQKSVQGQGTVGNIVTAPDGKVIEIIN
jgi:hypothetical protein